MLSEITHNGFKLVVLDFGFVCDELVQHILRSYRFSTKSILVSAFSIDYILAGTYLIYYIIADAYGIDYMLLDS